MSLALARAAALTAAAARRGATARGPPALGRAAAPAASLYVKAGASPAMVRPRRCGELVVAARAVREEASGNESCWTQGLTRHGLACLSPTTTRALPRPCRR